MPPRDGPAGNGDEHDGPDGTDPDGETRIGGKVKIRVEDKDPDDPEEKPQENDIGGHVVDGKSESPDGEDGGKVAEDEGCDCPYPPAVGKVCTEDLV